MDQLSAEMVNEFPERGMQWVKDRVETAVNETGEYSPRKADTVSFVCVCGWLHSKSFAARPSIGGLIRLLLIALRPAIDLWRRQTI